MSPLTKLFVGMLVVLALLQTAATVVYVHKEDVRKNALERAQAELTAARAEQENARQALMAAQANVTAIQQRANADAAQMRSELTTAQNQIGDLNVNLAMAMSTNATQLLDISRLTEGLKASQETTNKLQDEVGRLRGTNDTLVKQTSELNATISDLSNKLDVTERERKFLAEQFTEAQSQNQKLTQQLRGVGVSPERAAAAAVRVGPPITAVVRDVKEIAGVKYATISVGSADRVAPGMEFKIINRETGDYLGAVVVDHVEPNESTGRLEGPRIQDVRQGVEARTQL